MKKLTRAQLEPFLARYKTDEKILDVGSGGSSYHRFFPNRLTIDIDPARNPEVVGDAHALPFSENSFQTILCTEVLEHTHSPHIVVSELHRVLSVGGKVILTTRFVYPLHDVPHDYFRFTEYGLRHLFDDKRWEIVELVPETTDFDTFSVLFQRTIFQMDYKMNKLTKGVLLVLSKLIRLFGKLVRRRYGEIQKQTECPYIFASGYYIVARKR